ncbi:hypothetical protein AB6A40_009025 [Gnathostoma spinigerum]|uniref:Uncharacterized protein n=1 Tax=Gnathostoma spinigerum TaxID=75299 RepID=A0ABD6EXW1_9BILA
MRKEFIIDECRLLEAEPLTVECFAVDVNTGILAVARRSDTEDAATRDCFIEYWNVINAPFLFHVKTIYLGHVGAEGLLWISHGILLSCHADGCICVHNYHSSVVSKKQISAKPLWCIAATRQSEFCVGTDSGSVRFLTFHSGMIETQKVVTIDLSCRVLSLSSNGNIVAVGSIDRIDIIDCLQYVIKHTIKVPRTEKWKPTIVWALQFLLDFHLTVAV